MLPKAYANAFRFGLNARREPLLQAVCTLGLLNHPTGASRAGWNFAERSISEAVNPKTAGVYGKYRQKLLEKAKK
jgi:hypothetical protein